MLASDNQPRTLHRAAALDLVAEFGSAPDLFHLRCASPEDLAANADVNVVAGLRPALPDAADAIPSHLSWDWLPASAKHSGTGLAFVYKVSGAETRAHLAIAPPFPIASRHNSAEVIAELERSMSFDGAVAIVDLHAGKSWIAIAHDGKVAQSRTIARYVQRRHRAGGQSANRFRRNRQEWQRKFNAKLADALADMLASSTDPPHWLAIAGDQNAARAWLNECDIPRRCKVVVLPRTFDSRGTSRADLARIARAIWSARIYAPPAHDAR